MIAIMKTMFQVGLNERVPVPPEKRFLIHHISFVHSIIPFISIHHPSQDPGDVERDTLCDASSD